jgi:hypothetical protein
MMESPYYVILMADERYVSGDLSHPKTTRPRRVSEATRFECREDAEAHMIAIATSHPYRFSCQWRVDRADDAGVYDEPAGHSQRSAEYLDRLAAVEAEA